MNCREFWSQAPATAQSPGDSWSSHLEECPVCASEWAAQRSVAAGLRQVAADWSRLEAPPRLEGRLLQAFREQAGLSPARRPSVHRIATWIPVLAWAGASAAVLLLAASLVRVHAPQTATPKPSPVNSAILADSQYSSDAVQAETANLESGFVPLPNVEQLAPNEPGDLVTVEVPRSAMMALGFEVNPERAAETVQAEVMFGPDGVARAVRFLDDGTF